MTLSSYDDNINLFIDPGKSENLILNIFDITGKMIYNQNINVLDSNNPLTISSHLFSYGVYIFRLQSEKESVVLKTLIR
ncbi:MAG TPA: T9SS type A sorting domain-containing protein [Bacteroidales bacterium]|nr:T9SS type A sorting domain-containing protein [Bacteroidales bacterium]HPS17891.1 T9SS type A sorting domain-containing protein [Bacteroidales bacterium]